MGLTQCFIHQHPQILLHRAAFNPLIALPVSMFKIAVTQVPINPFLQTVNIRKLGCSWGWRRWTLQINHLSQTPLPYLRIYVSGGLTSVLFVCFEVFPLQSTLCPFLAILAWHFFVSCHLPFLSFTVWMSPQAGQPIGKNILPCLVRCISALPSSPQFSVPWLYKPNPCSQHHLCNQVLTSMIC